MVGFSRRAVTYLHYDLRVRIAPSVKDSECAADARDATETSGNLNTSSERDRAQLGVRDVAQNALHAGLVKADPGMEGCVPFERRGRSVSACSSPRAST